MRRLEFSGEDKVIVACVAMLTTLTIVALICIVIAPSQTVTIVPVMSGTVIAIASLAARHPPVVAPSGATPVNEEKTST